MIIFGWSLSIRIRSSWDWWLEMITEGLLKSSRSSLIYLFFNEESDACNKRSEEIDELV